MASSRSRDEVRKRIAALEDSLAQLKDEPGEHRALVAELRAILEDIR